MKVMAKSRTLYDKIWDNHLIQSENDTSLIYIDRHLVHEVTSPQAFEGLREREGKFVLLKKQSRSQIIMWLQHLIG